MPPSSSATPSPAMPSPPRSSSSSLRAVHHVLVVGGSGFIGSAVCRSALRHGLDVTSLSQSGKPPYSAGGDPQRRWTEKVTWRQGDLLQADGGWKKSALAVSTPSTPPIDGLICCVGGFGGVDWMRRINGEANLNALNAFVTPTSSIRRVAFVSAFNYQLPSFLQRGYIEGKRQVEQRLHQLFPSSPSAASPSLSSSTAPLPSPPAPSRSALIVQPGVVSGPPLCSVPRRGVAIAVRVRPLGLHHRPLSCSLRTAAASAIPLADSHPSPSYPRGPAGRLPHREDDGRSGEGGSRHSHSRTIHCETITPWSLTLHRSRAWVGMRERERRRREVRVGGCHLREKR